MRGGGSRGSGKDGEERATRGFDFHSETGTMTVIRGPTESAVPPPRQVTDEDNSRDSRVAVWPARADRWARAGRTRGRGLGATRRARRMGIRAGRQVREVRRLRLVPVPRQGARRVEGGRPVARGAGGAQQLRGLLQ